MPRIELTVTVDYDRGRVMRRAWTFRRQQMSWSDALRGSWDVERDCVLRGRELRDQVTSYPVGPDTPSPALLRDVTQFYAGSLLYRND